MSADPAPVAVITGASRGLGATLSRFLAAEGYDLVLVARGAQDLIPLRNEVRRLSPTSEAIEGDVADARVRAEVLTAVRRRPRLDLLVNNAGILGTTPLPSLADYDLRELDHLWSVNVVAPLALVQALLPELKRGHARVINISSDAARGGYPGWGAYGATKAALDLVSLTLAHELAADGVAVLSVDPGDMLTPGVRAALSASDLAGRPPPEVTLPFWAWLLHQDPARVAGHRFQAQADRWEVPT